jgi:hypothetical protein
MRFLNSVLGFRSAILETVADTNAAIVNPAAGGTLVVAINLGLVNSDNWIMVDWRIRMTKGVTAGRTGISVVQNPVGGVIGQVVWTEVPLQDDPPVNPNVFDLETHAAGVDWAMSGHMLLRVNLGGNKRLRLFAFSGGSNGTVAAGDARICAVVLR